VLETDGDQLDRSCEKLRCIAKSQGRQKYHTCNNKRKNANILRENCFLKHILEGKREGRIEVMGRGARRRK
jgi:hypothetical protein